MLEITITPEDFRDAPWGYSHPCVLHMALVRKFPGVKVEVGVQYVHIGKEPNQQIYKIDNDHWGDGTVPDGFSYNAINEFSRLAKHNLQGIPSKTLYLQPVEKLINN